MKRIRVAIVLFAAFAISFVLVLLSPSYSTSLIKDFLIPILSILAGVLLAAVGIFLASLGNLYAMVREIAKARSANIQKYLLLIKGAVNEVKADVLLILYSIPLAVLLIYISSVDLPFIQWPFTGKVLTKNVVLSTLVLTLLLLDFYAVFDCVKAMFRLNDHYLESIIEKD